LTVLYTVNVQNTGAAAIANAKVSNAFSPNLKRVLWCRDPGSGCTPSIPGPLADTVSVAAGATAVYRVELSVPPNFDDLLCHTVTVTLPGGEVDPTPQDDAANDLLCLTHGAPCRPPPPGFCPGSRQPDLEVSFVRDAEIDPVAQTILYTVAVQNGGAADAVGAQVGGLFSSALSSAIGPVAWCQGLGCTPVKPGPLADVLTVPAGETVVYQVKMTVPSVFDDLVCYTVAATSPGVGLEPGPQDNSQTALSCLTNKGPCPARPPGFCPGAAVALHPDLDVQFVGAPQIDFGAGTVGYTLLVHNEGELAAVGAQVSGAFSPNLVPVSWCKGQNCLPNSIPGPLADTTNIG
jgi:hypothetical protein